MCLCVCLCVCVCVYHIFFIHSSVSGHLDRFHVLVIVNSAAMNIGVHMLLKVYDFMGNKMGSTFQKKEVSSIY